MSAPALTVRPPPVLARLVSTGAGIALLWGVVTFVGVAAVSRGPGVGPAEAAVLAAAGAEPSGADASAHVPAAHVPAALGPLAARLAHAVTRPLGLSHLGGYRLAGALAAGLLAAIVALLAADLAEAGRGPSPAWAAALAPGLVLLAPRLLHLAVVSTPDVLAAALSLGVIWAYRRAALHDPARPRAGRGRRLVHALAAGVLFGLAVAARLDAVLLLPALAIHAALVRAVRGAPPTATPAPLPPRDDADPGDALAEDLEARLHGVPLALAAMAVLGPVVAVVLWPQLAAHPLRAAAAFLQPEAGLTWRGAPLARHRPPLGYPLLYTALATPAALLVTWIGGAAHAAARLAHAVRRDPGVDFADELLLLLAVALPFAAAQAGLAPLAAGYRPWVAALPALAVLAARALVSAARSAWPERAAALTGALALLVLYPAARGAFAAWPVPGAWWGELAGGAPGATGRRLPRQERGEAVAPLLAAVNERARDGARIRWIGVPPEAVRAYARDGRLRPDLGVAEELAAADLAVAVLDGGSRDEEYRAWAAFRTDRPADGVFLDEVPLAWIYARPGAWR
jgi:hypothetical protein